MGATLYETDYYAWTQEQAERLRRLIRDDRIDAEHLAEEVEDLGQGWLAAAESHVERILEHFLKIEFSGLEQPVGHWRIGIDTFRIKLEDRTTAAIRRRLQDRLDRRYRVARNRVLNALGDEVAGLAERLPADCPYDLDRVYDRNWFPSPRPGAQDRN
jgi:hypothetical protein